MANICDFSMRVKGSKEAVERVLSCFATNKFESEYNPNKKCFAGIYNSDYEPIKKREDGLYESEINGSCKWSVISSMGSDGYYREDEEHLTNYEEQSKDCEIEIFSEEPGMDFGEHFHYKDGECLSNDCENLDHYVDEDGEEQERHPRYIPDEDDYEWDMD